MTRSAEVGRGDLPGPDVPPEYPITHPRYSAAAVARVCSAVAA